MAKKPITVTTDMPFTVFSAEADTDYLLCRWIATAGGGFASRAGFFAQQACEKYMKALLVQEEGAYPATHELVLLAGACHRHAAMFGAPGLLALLKALDAFDQVGRYGGAAKFDPHAVKTSSMQTAGVMTWHEGLRRGLDAFAFHVRAQLDHSKVGWRDQIAAILEGDERALLMGTWRGSPSLLEVLTTDNAWFKPAGGGGQ